MRDAIRLKIRTPLKKQDANKLIFIKIITKILAMVIPLLSLLNYPFAEKTTNKQLYILAPKPKA